MAVFVVARRILAGLFLVVMPVAAFAQPVFDMQFEPDPVSAGNSTRLVYTIDNAGTGSVVTDAAFTNVLPAGLTVATGSVTNDCNGTVSAVSGGGTVSYSGGSVGLNATCSISLLVATTTAGSFTNPTGDLTSSLGNSGSATATLDVSAPGLSETLSLGQTSLSLGQTTTLTAVMESQSGSVLTGITTTIDLPPQIEIAPIPNAQTNCTGQTITSAAAGGSQIATSGTFFTAASSCTYSVAVRAVEPGSFDIASQISSFSADGGIAAAVPDQAGRAE